MITLFGVMKAKIRDAFPALCLNLNNMIKLKFQTVLLHAISEQQYGVASKGVHVIVSAINNMSRSQLSIRHDLVGFIYAYLQDMSAHDLVGLIYAYLQDMKKGIEHELADTIYAYSQDMEDGWENFKLDLKEDIQDVVQRTNMVLQDLSKEVSYESAACMDFDIANDVNTLQIPYP